MPQESLFDAVEYLHKIDPGQGYTIEVLTGGIMNVTLRATKAGQVSENGYFPNRSSFVMKYTPPFVAGMGEKHPLTAFRQNIEARALSLFSDSLVQVCVQSEVSVPTLLHHDSEAHVIIMSDLGTLSNVASLFSELVGYIGSSYEEQAYLRKQSATDRGSSEAMGYFEDMGRRLGRFFAKLHSPKSLSAVTDEPERGVRFLHSSELDEFAFESIVKPVERNLELFPAILSREEALMLYERAASDHRSRDKDDARALALRDCWPGALLISPWSLSNFEETPAMAVVDWEFATIGRGLDGDLAQLLGQFAMMECAAQCRADTIHAPQLKTLVSAMSQTYRRVSMEEGSSWSMGKWRPGAEGLAPLDSDNVGAKMLRSSFLTHGVEIIHWALVKPWNCQDPACNVGSSHTSVKEDCKMVQSMIRRGVWYLRHAGENVQAFCSEKNQSALNNAYLNGWWLLDLFPTN